MINRSRIANGLVWLANRLVRDDDNPLAPWPYYRPVDTYMPIPGLHEFVCGAYSYEYLKSFVEQDGPDGFGATATVKWLISEDNWESFEGKSIADLKAMFAEIGWGLEPPEPLGAD